MCRCIVRVCVVDIGILGVLGIVKCIWDFSVGFCEWWVFWCDIIVNVRVVGEVLEGWWR